MCKERLSRSDVEFALKMKRLDYVNRRIYLR